MNTLKLAKSVIRQTAGRPAAKLSFTAMQRQIHAMQRAGVSMLHTARPFSFYRKVFYQNRSAKKVLAELQSKRIVDVGCGYTPFLQDSMYQTCDRAGIEFHAADPVLANTIKFGPRERMLTRMFGSSARFNTDAAGLHRATKASAQALPFRDNSVDEILSNYLIFVWIEDEETLNEVFAEFLRVLKPGGVAKVYPFTEWQNGRFTLPKLQKTLSNFSVSQSFVYGGLDFRIPPSWLTEFRKNGH